MTQEEILEYNERCAKFLGSELKNDGEYDYWTYDHLGFDSSKISAVSWICGNFEFNSDWNWIMEVVNAIEKLNDFYIQIEESACYVYDISKFTNEQCNPFILCDLGVTSKKEAVVKAINQFLIWYNQTTNE